MEEATADRRNDGSVPTRRAVILGAVTLAAALPGSQPRLNRRAEPWPVGEAPVEALPPGEPRRVRTVPPARTAIINTFASRDARYWGLEAPGVMTRLPGTARGIVLTIDFCGGPGGNGYDQALLAALRERHVPATLFLNSRWVAANLALARELSAEPLFELANHGTWHKPLSTTGNSAYGIPGTKSVGEVYDEIMTNDAVLAGLTRVRPRYFRSGTAYMDDVAADIVLVLGATPTGFSINGDGGATYPAATVAKEAGKAQPGDIIICHGNHPGGGTAAGMVRALDTLAAAGMAFLPLP